ncbi:MAG: hypothetical protein HKL99_13990, partial [Burkholderiales bacterium]|nr:hypothetical protein [Burkholderiales bacterium]
MNNGLRARERFLANMQKIAVGARLTRRNRIWVVAKQKRWDTSVELTLQSGRRTVQAHIMVSLSGPCLADAGLRPIRPLAVSIE